MGTDNQPPVETIQGEARAREVIQADRDADADPTNAAREAIRSAFMTSVSGGTPHPYCVSLAYPTMAEMHKAHSAFLAFQSEARAVPSGGERIKTLPTDAVLAVTEAILREAREHGADSPVDRGDAEQLAMAAVGAMPAHQADREAIARVIDPSLWERRDFDAGRRDYYEAFVKVGWSGMPFEQWVERGTKDSLAKADAILTLSPTPSARRDGGGDLQIGTRCSRCGMAAPKSLAADCDRPECEYRLPPATEKAEK